MWRWDERAARGVAAVIAEILPEEAVGVDTREELLDIELFPEERATVARSAAKRRREYTTARACARAALAALGLPPSPILNGERGQPLWPGGVVGSITHCAGYRACALARAGELAALGIDAEPNEPLPEGVLSRVARAQERPLLAELALAEPAVSWERLLFSAKEAVYKVWFPLAACRLSFEDTVVAIDRHERTFQAHLLKPWPDAGAEPGSAGAGRTDRGRTGRGTADRGRTGRGTADREKADREKASCGRTDLPILEGRWLAREGLLLSAIALPHHSSA